MEAFGAVSGVLIIVAVLLLAVLGILLPLSAYSAQKYAYMCYKELRVTNELLRRKIDVPPEAS